MFKKLVENNNSNSIKTQIGPYGKTLDEFAF